MGGWLRRAPGSPNYLRIKSLMKAAGLNTVCEEARCPNIGERWEHKAATFMILGNLCTRGCGFCSVPKGSPSKQDMRLDPEEPANVARMAARMNLRYVVITSVDRDDLRDGGAQVVPIDSERNLVNKGGGDQPAVVEHGEMVDQLHHRVHRVLDDDHRLARGQGADQLDRGMRLVPGHPLVARTRRRACSISGRRLPEPANSISLAK